MINQVRSRNLAAALIFAGTTAATPSIAMAQYEPVVVQGESGLVRSELVSFGKLDLARAKDQKMLNFRVAGAIQRVCQLDLGRDGLQDRGYYQCEKSAWEDANPQIEAAISHAIRLALLGRPSTFSGSVAVSAS